MAALSSAYDKFLYQDYKSANSRAEKCEHSCDLTIDVEPPILCHKEVISKSSKALGMMVTRPFKEADKSTLDFSGE